MYSTFDFVPARRKALRGFSLVPLVCMYHSFFGFIFLPNSYICSLWYLFSAEMTKHAIYVRTLWYAKKTQSTQALWENNGSPKWSLARLR